MSKFCKDISNTYSVIVGRSSGARDILEVMEDDAIRLKDGQAIFPTIEYPFYKKVYIDLDEIVSIDISRKEKP